MSWHIPWNMVVTQWTEWKREMAMGREAWLRPMILAMCEGIVDKPSFPQPRVEYQNQNLLKKHFYHYKYVVQV